MRIIAKLSVLACISLAVSQLALAQFSGGRAPASATNAQSALAANEAGIAAYKKRDFTTAAKQFEVACNGGLTMGCYNLANRYYLAEGVPSNKPYALQVYIKSCNSGIAEACSAQGAMTEMGEGIPANPAAARNLYARACQGGYQPACKHSAPVAQNARPTVNVAQKRVPQANRIAQSTPPNNRQRPIDCVSTKGAAKFTAPKRGTYRECINGECKNYYEDSVSHNADVAMSGIVHNMFNSPEIYNICRNSVDVYLKFAKSGPARYLKIPANSRGYPGHTDWVVVSAKWSDSN